ncbi:Protein of unknown function [Nocardioides exalbidus]|uniref:GmrSD restriction endonucleases C-terminal domain-containing protein n=1 Tax=Nocardioides exalbidus TaxID=402596 RepID=A0A1H4X0G6_9ACTN|nr:HNH endonuclease family protein [Nocardioides exalbidus]SEC98428.1 Protein of unknown function [Nocardioides exalbidus]
MGGMRWRTSVATAALAVLALAGCSLDGGQAPAIAADGIEASPAAGSSGPVRQLLGSIEVKGRAPMTDYGRDRFGQAWLDADRNGCDTRNDVLRDHLTDLVLEPGTGDCVVTSGTLDDPYTAATIHFVRGDGTLVDIDHVVALGNAWATGAAAWDVRQRAAFANDPMNLLPVDASANRQKGDGDAATWLPPNKAFRCAYVARQVGVKAKYGLWLTPPERAAVERVLATCPDQAAVPDSGAPLLVDHDISDPGPPS